MIRWLRCPLSCTTSTSKTESLTQNEFLLKSRVRPVCGHATAGFLYATLQGARVWCDGLKTAVPAAPFFKFYGRNKALCYNHLTKGVPAMNSVLLLILGLTIVPSLKCVLGLYETK